MQKYVETVCEGEHVTLAQIGVWNGAEWDAPLIGIPTHWQPLPAPPTDREAETITEIIARAFHNADAQHFAIAYDGAIPEYYTNRAVLAIAALTEAGFAIVPVAPSAEMIAAGSRHSHIAKGDDRGHRVLRNLNAMTIYRDMIQAAQGTSGSAQDAQRLDPQGAGPVRQDAPETPLSTPLPSGSIER